jgi:acetyltransferase-like isoleucine patch superfamily enzyme
VRDALVWAGVVALTPAWVVVWLERPTGRDGIFRGFAELLSLVPGLPGVFARRSFYRMTLECCATDVHFGFGTTLAHRQVTVGRRVYVGSRCSLGMCQIGDDATLGSNVDLLSGRRQHGFGDPRRPVQEQAGSFTPVRLGRNCWVGNSAVVMADVGDGAVVGAGSVVVTPAPAGAVVAGNPAVVKRMRAAA